MPHGVPSANLLPVEAERVGAIHLVALPSSVPAANPALPKSRALRTSSRKSQHILESERMSTLALAGAALLAPLVWIGHALLVWLDIL